MAALSDAAADMLKTFCSKALAQMLWSLDSQGYHELRHHLMIRALAVLQNELKEPEAAELSNIFCIFDMAPAPQQTFELEFLPSLASSLVRIASGEEVTAAELQLLSSKATHLGNSHTCRVLEPVGLQVTSGEAVQLRWVSEARSTISDIFDDEKKPLDALPITDKMERVSVPAVDREAYITNMAGFGVDNFGKIGGRCLFNQLGIGRANENWLVHAKQFIEAWTHGVGRRADDWKANTVHRRIYTFAEYHFSSTLKPMLPVLEGTSFVLNGLRTDPETARRPWLCAVPLRISKWVDRTLCAEFQLLGEVLEMLNRSGIELTSPELRHSVHGFLSLYLSEPSCVSCVGAMKQFQTLLPGVTLYVDCSSVVEPLTARTAVEQHVTK
eukprot:TRINITY_DN5448_c0_g3_i1.p1 TRINITY_DN5448_c0_g3~~TRINITY_DN5448_c0_g3_i1.p1  ORF type:complete len:432 (+),score=67.06 TRINITY_DN5448_c0_g3_i1:143-1297(+)